jgi:hypothetical protein
MAEMEEFESEFESESERRYMKDPKSKTIEGFVIGLHILSKYMEDGLNQRFFCGAEHDVLYIYADAPAEESPEGLRLSELGFHRDEESWAFFT